MIPKSTDKIKPTAEKIIEKLGSIRGRPNFCFCPAHNDQHNPNLHVSEDKNGKVLVHCHAGCEQDTVIDALRARGLWPEKRDANIRRSEHKEQYREQQKQYREQRRKIALERAEVSPDDDEPFDEDKKKLREHRHILRIAAGVREHEYVGRQQPIDYFRGRGLEPPANAMLLPRGQTHRLPFFQYKGFPAAVLPIAGPRGLQGVMCTLLTRDGTKNLRGKTTGKNIRRIYGTARDGYVQLGHFNPDRPLIMAEGVETAMSAASLANGLPAIAALSVANMKNIMPLPPCSELIIAGDNDAEGTGRKAAEAAAAVMASTGKVVRIAIPRHHKDWNDALRDPNADHDRLGAAILNAKQFDGPIASVTSLGMQDFRAIQFPPRRFLLKPWLTTTGLTMIDALPGHGKTWLALSIAYAVASERPLLEWSVEQPGKVLYVDGELPGELLQQRLKELGPELPESDFRVLSHSQFEARGMMMLDIGTQEGRDLLDAEIERHQMDVIILDSVTTLVRSGEDNDVESWRAIQTWSLKHRARGRAVIYLHHHGRSGNPRGTSAREIVLDARIKLTRDENLSGDKVTAFKLEFPKAREFYGADAAPMIAYLSTQSGTVEWRRETVKDSTREQVAALLRDGFKPADIAKELKITRGRVSQIMKENNVAVPTKKGPQRNV
jgi:putative DNA primase/helicase